MSTVPDRKAVRQAFAALLAEELVGDGKPVQAVYRYVTGDFAGQSPVIVVGSKGSGSQLIGRGGTQSSFTLEVTTLVLRGEEGSATYTQEDADDAMDELDRHLRQLIEDNQDHELWVSVQYDGDSSIEPVEVGGAQYWMEPVRLRVNVL